MRRDDIPSQDELKGVFTRMVDQHKLPHALLIHGNEGGVSLSLALFLTTYLMCDNRSEGDACGTCPSCAKMSHFTHPDVHFIVPVNNTKTVRKELANTDRFIDEWREVMTTNPYLSLRDWYERIGIERSQGFIGDREGKELRQKLSLRAYEGGAKVFIIWHADRMNPTFGNKILKSLEEPNDETHFILVTEQPAQLLTTILSRTQRFQEDFISDAELAEFLQNRYNIAKQRAVNLAFRAEGNVHAAIKEALNNDDPWLLEFREWMRLCYKKDLIGLFNWSEKMAKHNRDAQRLFVGGALKMLDRCFRMGWIETPIPMEGDEAAFYKGFAPFINASNVRQFMDLLEEASFHVERNVNEKIVWYDSSIKAVRFMHAGKKATERV
ncbi:MAG: hypothetical protein RLP15_08760 [Cryomorphaceae bacterium]